MFSCEHCEIFKNSFFYRTPLVATSGSLSLLVWYDQFQRRSNEITNAKRKRKGNELFSSQREISEAMNTSSSDDDDCSIDDDETNVSNDQDFCKDAESPTPNNIKKLQKKRPQQQFTDKVDTKEQLMKDVAIRIKESGDSFATSIAAEIRKMPDRIRSMVKNGMKQVLLKYQTIILNPP